MADRTTETPVIRRVRELVDPIASDLRLDVYDIEQRGGTMRVTLDTPAGSESGVDLDQLALATRLISRELDHDDPIPGTYTLEVTSPGLERALRTPEHFRREVGKVLSIRLSNVDADERRIQGTLVAADDTTATIRVGAGDDAVERRVELDSIDRARTVFEWGPQPKPGGKGTAKGKKKSTKQKSAKQRSAKQTRKQSAKHTSGTDSSTPSSPANSSNKEPS